MTIFVPFVVTMEVGFLVIVQYLTILLSLGFRSKSLDVGPKSGFDVQGHGLTGWLGALRITDRDWSTAQLTNSPGAEHDETPNTTTNTRVDVCNPHF